MLELRSVGKRYGAATVLDDVTLSVDAGQVLALCGENGAGKSTLVRIVSGVIPHGEYRGAVWLDGHEAQFRSPRDAEQQGIRILPQELVFFPALSVDENIMAGILPARHGLVDRFRLRAKAHEVCELVGLHEQLSVPMRRLSRSDQQLACIARALVSDPRVLILDEPTAALPRPDANRLFAVIMRLVGQGHAVIYISHYLDELSGLAARVAVLRNGRLIMPPRPVPPIAEIAQAMLGAPPARRSDAKRRTSTMNMGPVLELDVAELRLGRRVLLKDVRLAVAPGEVLGIAGLGGSGRDELLRVCVGAQQGNMSGEARIGGKRISPYNPHIARGHGVVFLTDERRREGIIPANAIANALLGQEETGSRAGLRRPRPERLAANTALDAVRVAPRDRTKLVSLLSGGNQQRVMFSRPLVRPSRVLVLGEPTRGIDVGTREAIHQLIHRLADEGKAIIVSSSDPAELAEVCDHVIVLWRGHIAAELVDDDLGERTIAYATVTPPEWGPDRERSERPSGAGLATSRRGSRQPKGRGES